MPNEITFAVKGIPQQKGSTRAFMPKGARYPIITSTNKNVKSWERLIASVAQNHAPDKLIEGAFSISLGFGMPKPKSYPKTRELDHVKRPDLDKLVRATLDALTGIIYKDDSQMTRMCNIEKYYSDTPGVTVKITTS